MSRAEHESPHPSREARDYKWAAVSLVQIVTGVGLILFWVLFFTIGLAPSTPPPGYFEFEHSFAVPDLILAASLLYAAWLWRSRKGNHRIARTITLLCAGALMFLGLLDASFNLRSGIYFGSIVDAVSALAINLWCLGCGGYLAFTMTASAQEERQVRTFAIQNETDAPGA